MALRSACTLKSSLNFVVDFDSRVGLELSGFRNQQLISCAYPSHPSLNACFQKSTTDRCSSLSQPSPYGSSRAAKSFVEREVSSRTPRKTLFRLSSSASVGPASDSYGGNGSDGKGTGGGGNGGNDGNGSGDFSEKNGDGSNWITGALFKGWNERIKADPEFPFKVLTEQVIGVTACVIGDMSSRPNFGLNELDFVFSTLVVGSLVNFLLMYMLAPVSTASVVTLPGIFSKCPTGHMFEAGAYTLGERTGTFIYKGLQFATAGFIAGLLGTAISNTLLEVRKKLQPGFQLQNPPPPTLLNSLTWALHLGVSSNLRYQCLNGFEAILVRKLSPSVFKAFVFCIRGFNNIIGGSTFAMLAKYTGAQKSASAVPKE